MKIKVQKVGGIWHGTIDDHPDVDVRALTEDIARRKVEEIARRKVNDVASTLTCAPPPSKSPQEINGTSARLRRKRRMS